MASAAEIARRAQDTYTAARDGVTDLVASARKAILTSRAQRLDSLFPEQSVTLAGDKPLRLADVGSYLKSLGPEAYSALTPVGRALADFTAAKKTELQSDLQTLSSREEALRQESGRSAGNPEKLREIASTLEEVQQTRKERAALLKQLDRTAADQASSQLDPSSLRNQAARAEKAKTQRAALNAPDHPLRQTLQAAQQAVKTLEARVQNRGCRCQEEKSEVYQSGGGYFTSQLCVLRSEGSGKPRVWMNRYDADCSRDCARWIRDSGYTDLCATQSQRQEFQTELENSRQVVAASERALADAESVAESELAALNEWRP